MIDLKKLSPLPKDALKEGMALPLDVYVHLPQNESVIHFRKQGDVVGPEDIRFFNKVSPSNLLMPIDQVELLYELMANGMKNALASGDVNSPVVKQAASELLDTLSSPASVDVLLKGVDHLVSNLIQTFTKTPSVIAYDDVLKRAVANATDLLTGHHRQVSAISVLMALTLGDFSMDDISDLAAAGMVHDLGLSEITQDLAHGHLKGFRKISNQEKIIYMRHVQLGLDRMKKEKINVTPGMQRIIELHHENWDGSGFKAYVGNRIFRPARVLRIADDLVSLIQDKTFNLGFKGALEKLKLETGLYDLELLNQLLSKQNAA